MDHTAMQDPQPKVILTKLGNIEVAVIGSGTPVLILHGSPSGIDGAIAMCRFLPPDRFMSICVSRPGYLETPLPSDNPSIAHETDLLAALLDELEIQRVGVLAWSGGGPSAYLFTARYHRRVSALVTIAAVSMQYIAPKNGLMQRIIFDTSIGARAIAYMAKHRPDHLVQEALAGEGSLRSDELAELTRYVLSQPEQKRLVLDTAITCNTSGKREAGWNNDKRNFAQIDSLGLEDIRCPTLIVHGDADTDAVPEHSKHAHARIPRSRLILMDRGTHLSFFAHPDAAKVQHEAIRWLWENQ